MIWKPQYGVQLNRFHPLERGLIGAWLLNEYSGQPTNLITKKQAELANGAAWYWNGVNCAVDYSAVKTDLEGTVHAANAVTTWVFGYQQTVPIGEFCYFLLSSGHRNFTLYWSPTLSKWVTQGATDAAWVSNSVFDYDRHQLVFILDDVNQYYASYTDGVFDGSGTSDPNYAPVSGDKIFIGGRPDSTSRYCAGVIEYCYAFNRILLPKEIAALNADPYQMFRQPNPVRMFAVPAGVTYTITASGGTFSLSGSAADLLKGSKIAAGVGSFSLSGTAADLLRGLALSAGAGSLTLSGSAVDLLKGSKIAAGSGSFALVGSDATLTYTPVGAYILSCEAGSFALSGADVSLLRDYILPVDPGSYVISGVDAALLLSRILAAAGGSFTLTGADAEFLRDYNLICDGGTYTLTGADVALTYSGFALPNGVVTITFTVRQPAVAFAARQPGVTFTAN